MGETALENFKEMMRIPENREYIPFLRQQIRRLERKKISNDVYYAEQLEKPDELKHLVKMLLTRYPQTADRIWQDLLTITKNESITRQMVVARLIQLCDEDIAAREDVKIGGKRRKAYYLIEIERED